MFAVITLCIPMCNHNSKFIIYIALKLIVDFETTGTRNWATISVQHVLKLKKMPKEA